MIALEVGYGSLRRLVKDAGGRAIRTVNNSVESSDYDTKIRQAQKYQEDIAGPKPLSLTADALKRPQRYQAGSSRSTKSLGSGDRSDYRKSATTRTTWSESNNEDENMTVEITEDTGRVKVGSTPAVASGLNSNPLPQDQPFPPPPPPPPPRHLAGFTDGESNEMGSQLRDDKSHQRDSSYAGLQAFEDEILNLAREEGVLVSIDFKNMSINPEEDLSERMSNGHRKREKLREGSRSTTRRGGKETTALAVTSTFDPEDIARDSPLQPELVTIGNGLEGHVSAKDAQGTDISPDAKWTKIARALVSPEALDEAQVRYEA